MVSEARPALDLFVLVVFGGEGRLCPGQKVIGESER
jgi:hypothetical protein